jgi:transcriptional regulator with XRE-family HTH domain
MNEAAKGIGEKIRELRLKKGMTQRELAGDRITRNMLSLIESGSASPSIQTLQYISERLKTPLAYFFSETERDVAIFQKMSVMDELKEHYKNKNYAECLSICSALSDQVIDDEIAFILTCSHIACATEKAGTLDMRSAMRELDKAEAVSNKSIYCDRRISGAIQYLRDLFSNICSDSITDMMCDMNCSCEFITPETVQYFCSLRAISREEAPPFSFPKGSFHERHIYALNLLAEDRINEAQKRLRELSLNPETPYYMQYRVLTDLENAANISGDYRLAYSSSRRRLEFVKQNSI